MEESVMAEHNSINLGFLLFVVNNTSILNEKFRHMDQAVREAKTLSSILTNREMGHGKVMEDLHPEGAGDSH
jgi:hypothetical protein